MLLERLSFASVNMFEMILFSISYRKLVWHCSIEDHVIHMLTCIHIHIIVHTFIFTAYRKQLEAFGWQVYETISQPLYCVPRRKPNTSQQVFQEA